MARASVLTLDPRRGGVPALAHAISTLLAASGHDPALIYRATDDVPASSRLAVAKYFLTTPPVRHLRINSFRCVAVADYPVPLRYQYHLLRLAGPILRAPIAAVVAGSSHTGLPLALARYPYVLWVATVYADELRGRAGSGDPWAAGLLRHRDWPVLETQEQLVHERASAILALSPYTAARIAERWPGVAHKLRTVLYPIDTELFRPDGAPAEPPYILLTARIRDPRKNADLLLRAFARVRTEFPTLRLVIAGDEPLSTSVALAAQLELGDSVTFAGYVSREEQLALYQRASLFALPSLQEGLGISVLEAMACGLPVVSTRCGGPEGVVQPGVTGLLAPNGDEDAMAEAILGVLRHPGRARSMGEAGRSRAVEEFSRARVETQLRDAFVSVFGRVF